MGTLIPSGMAHPLMSLRGGNAIDNGQHPPPYDSIADDPSDSYVEENHWGIHHLDAESWRHYLPILCEYSTQNMSNTLSSAVDTFLFSLRPPDRNPPRFGILTQADRQQIVSLLDRLAFDNASVWQEEAMLALEEYWAPGALYRGANDG
jgi:hypothetical protein